ncbi:GNAT family N-acetyltransferase [Sphingobacterium sp. Mn56C]|uniref:GNAT family N-acetyltransferase n=1 Tax=Sphingobacterium sp. Mn56C TaxID=3395261 RepID=UPI003BC3B195
MKTIRKASVADAFAIAPLIDLAMEHMIVAYIFAGDRPQGLSYLRQLISRLDTPYSYRFINVFEEDHKILGHICLYPMEEITGLRHTMVENLPAGMESVFELPADTYPAAPGEIYIDTLAVLPEAQGKGIGSQLLQHVMTTYRNQKHYFLSLLVAKDNPKAHKLYRSLGFVDVAERNLMDKEFYYMQWKSTT